MAQAAVDSTPPSATGPHLADDIARRMDNLPVNRLHIAAVGLCAAAMFVDGMELTMSSVFGAVFTPEAGVSPTELAWLISALGLGSLVGGPIFGAIGDRLGRRWALISALVTFGAFSVLGAFSPDIPLLTATRFFAAFAIGAFQPLMTAYLVDVLPARRRGQLILYTSVVAGLGASTPMFITRYVMGMPNFPVDAWRATLALAGIAAGAVAGVLAAFMLESPRWLAATGRSGKALQLCRRFEAASGAATPMVAAVTPAEVTAAVADAAAGSGFASLLKGGFAGRYAFSLGVFLCLSVAHSFIVLQGVMFAHRGYGPEQALLFSGIAVAVIPAGSLLNSFLVDRVERRLAIGLLSAWLAMVTLSYLFAREPGPAVVAAGAYNMFIGSTSIMIMIYMAELFPPRLRSFVVSTGGAFWRFAASLAPLVLIPLLYSHGEWVVIAATAAALLAIVGAIMLLGPRVQGQARLASAAGVSKWKIDIVKGASPHDSL